MSTPHLRSPHARPPWRLVAPTLVVLVLVFAAGCGGGATSESSQAPTGEASAPLADAAAPAKDSGGAAPTDVGARVYAQRCVLCHGSGGAGDGPASAGLNPKPRNLRDASYMSTRTDEQLLEIIRNGKGAMPAWGKNNTLTEEEIQAVLRHIRSFTGGS
uniref:Cytochrome c n=1 Tax=Eiseniibacteriota bacterium TaxID=2212470 RepID=A0A832I681_UNCEI